MLRLTAPSRAVNCSLNWTFPIEINDLVNIFSFNILSGAIQIYYAENSIKNRMLFFLFQTAESRNGTMFIYYSTP